MEVIPSKILSQTLVSVVMCTFNGANYLQEQLDSIINQTHSLLEIIIIDDHSFDDTVKIIKRYQAKDARISFYENSENLGVNKNFEKAISLANAEFICTCDQDDVWFPEKIQTLLASIGESDLVYSDSQYLGNKGEVINHFLSFDLNMKSISSPLSLLFFNVVSGHAMMFRRRLFERSLPFPDDILYDNWLAFNAAIFSKINYINLPLQYYRQHDSNVVGAKGYRNKRTKEITKSEKQIALTKLLERKASQLLDGSEEKKIALAILDTYQDNNLVNRIRRAFLFYKYGEELLALRKKGNMYKMRYCFKLVRKIV